MTRQRLINQTMLFGLVVILVAGCGTPVSPSSTAAKTDERPSDQRETIGAPAEDTAKQTEKASTPEEVTLYLPGMNLKLKILWGDWPNKVKKALLGLKGVRSVEDEWERELESNEDLDLLFVTFDTQQVTIEAIKKTIEKHGFRVEVKK